MILSYDVLCYAMLFNALLCYDIHWNHWMTYKLLIYIDDIILRPAVTCSLLATVTTDSTSGVKVPVVRVVPAVPTVRVVRAVPAFAAVAAVPSVREIKDRLTARAWGRAP